MKRTLIAAALLCGTALAGCQPGGVSSTPVVGNSVAAAEIALTNAERLALKYTSLPRCPAATVICSDPATVQRIKEYDNKAYAAVVSARSNEALIGLALSAIDAFGGVIPK